MILDGAISTQKIVLIEDQLLTLFKNEPLKILDKFVRNYGLSSEISMYLSNRVSTYDVRKKFRPDRREQKRREEHWMLRKLIAKNYTIHIIWSNAT